MSADISFSLNLVNRNVPLDPRVVVENTTGLTTLSSYYKGMMVVSKDTNKVYILNVEPSGTPSLSDWTSAALDAHDITSGTINNARLPSTISQTSIHGSSGVFNTLATGVITAGGILNGTLKLPESPTNIIYASDDHTFMDYGSGTGDKTHAILTDGYFQLYSTGSEGAEIQLFDKLNSTTNYWAIDNDDSRKFRIFRNDVVGVNSIVVDPTNGYVGIGTYDPTRMLDVNGDAYISGQIYSSSSTNLNIRAIYLGQNPEYYIYSDGSSEIVYSANDGWHSFINGDILVNNGITFSDKARFFSQGTTDSPPELVLDLYDDNDPADFVVRHNASGIGGNSLEHFRINGSTGRVTYATMQGGQIVCTDLGTDSLFARDFVISDIFSINRLLTTQPPEGAICATAEYGMIFRPFNFEGFAFLNYNSGELIFRIKNNGNVGIGISNPTNRLYAQVNDFDGVRVASLADENLGVILQKGSGDGVTGSAYNGGIGSWYGIGFRCEHPDQYGIKTVRHMFNTRDGSTWMTGPCYVNANAVGDTALAQLYVDGDAKFHNGGTDVWGHITPDNGAHLDIIASNELANTSRPVRINPENVGVPPGEMRASFTSVNTYYLRHIRVSTGSETLGEGDEPSIVPSTNNYGLLGTADFKFYKAYVSTVNATTVNATTVIATTVLANLVNANYINNGIQILDNDGNVIGNLVSGGGSGGLIPGIPIISDDRLKHNEEDVVDALGTIDKLKVQKYDKTKIMLEENYNGDLSNVQHFKEIGLIAQDVQQIPELAFSVGGGEGKRQRRDPETGQSVDTDEDMPYNLNYNNIFSVAVQAIQELHQKVKILEAEIQTLKNNSAS